jgi:hypothetical protein
MQRLAFVGRGERGLQHFVWPDVECLAEADEAIVAFSLRIIARAIVGDRVGITSSMTTILHLGGIAVWQTVCEALDVAIVAIVLLAHLKYLLFVVTLMIMSHRKGCQGGRLRVPDSGVDGKWLLSRLTPAIIAPGDVSSS